MPRLNIPKEYRSELAQVKRLDPVVVAAIRTALDSVAASGVGLQQSAIQAIKSTNLGSELTEIGRVVASLYGLRSRMEIQFDQFINDVCDGMENLAETDFRLAPAERPKFRENLSTLLGSETFALSSKVFDLATDDERTFCSARILTDLRPVFGPVIGDGPRGMVVVNLLKLSYHQGSERHKEFFVSLDSEDVKELKKILDRAEAKADALKKSIKDLRIFGLDKE